jgi:Domain of unknown function(DUF2779)
MKPAPLTKSRLLLASECPRKLAYIDDRKYANTRADDEFLESLAQSGHQVGALSRAMHPDGIEIRSGDLEEQIAATNLHLQKPSVTLFEPTFRVGNLLVRIDILIKHGNVVQLIEVKSKSHDRTNPDKSFRSRKGIRSNWRPYLQDVAFQTHVLRIAQPEWVVHPFLMLVDPTVVCSVDSLATRILTEKKGRNVTVTIDPTLRVRDIRPALLTTHDVSVEVDEILNGEVKSGPKAVAFLTFVDQMADTLARGIDPEPSPTSECRSCEFYCSPSARTDTHRSGWAECMEIRHGRPAPIARTATIFGLYSDRKTDKRIASDQFLLSELDEADVELEEDPTSISPSHRHQLQVEEAQPTGRDKFLRTEALRVAFATWRFPLHFIDFETSRPCLPFHARRKPNELLLFQFSHHILDEEGRLRHATQCLVAEPGKLPNRKVVEALRDALGKDGGTVIHWWDHERSVLQDIRGQLAQLTDPDDQNVLQFLDSLLAAAKTPDARLVDLGRLVSNTAFFAGTGGRSSIKKVLPAVLQLSSVLRGRYSAPTYGTEAMPSLNFDPGWIWWRCEEGRIADPYTLLEPIFSDADLNQILATAESSDFAPFDFVDNGGAAMVAFAELQRPDLPELERERYKRALLRYCELDTLAMVMVYEALREWIEA